MVGHDQVGFFTDLDLVRRDVDPLVGQVIDFIQEHFRVHHHAVSQQAGFPLEDARRDQMADELLPVDHHGVAGVVSPLEADHHVRHFCQQVHDLSLALIPPLGTDDNDVCHLVTPLKKIRTTFAFYVMSTVLATDFRRLRKKSRIRSLQSSRITPAMTSMRWLSRGSAERSQMEPAPPHLGSSVP